LDPHLQVADDQVDYEPSEGHPDDPTTPDHTIRDRKNRLGRMPDTAFPIFQVCWSPDAQLAHERSKCTLLAEELGYPLQSILDEVADRRRNLLAVLQRIPDGPMPSAHEVGYREEKCWYDLKSGNHSSNKRKKCKGPRQRAKDIAWLENRQNRAAFRQEGWDVQPPVQNQRREPAPPERYEHPGRTAAARYPPREDLLITTTLEPLEDVEVRRYGMAGPFSANFPKVLETLAEGKPLQQTKTRLELKIWGDKDYVSNVLALDKEYSYVLKNGMAERAILDYYRSLYFQAHLAGDKALVAKLLTDHPWLRVPHGDGDRNRYGSLPTSLAFPHARVSGENHKGHAMIWGRRSKRYVTVMDYVDHEDATSQEDSDHEKKVRKRKSRSPESK